MPQQRPQPDQVRDDVPRQPANVVRLH
jgi:hypothetical protein